MTYHKILVPLDGSAVSRWVLSRSERLLTRPGTELLLLGVAEASAAQAADPLFRADPRHKPLHDELASLKASLLARNIAVDAEVRFGDPATEILREAATSDFDLVAMATHGRTGLNRLLFGSVALKVLQACPLPMLLFRPLLRHDDSLSPVERTDPARFQRVLVPLDGSAVAEEIVPALERLARTFGASLHLFTAISGGADEAAHRRDADDYLARWTRIFASIGIDATTEIRAGEAAAEALDCVRERGLDAIAMTTHGRSGIHRAVYGSVAEKVLSHAEVPLLVVRSRSTHTRPFQPVDPGRKLRVEP
jgi:nucleotide-binding universal stress UspA family protein